MLANARFKVGDKVFKTTGDYTYTGIVVAVFAKLDGTTIRYVVEDDRGILMIMNAKQLEDR